MPIVRPALLSSSPAVLGLLFAAAGLVGSSPASAQQAPSLSAPVSGSLLADAALPDSPVPHRTSPESSSSSNSEPAQAQDSQTDTTQTDTTQTRTTQTDTTQTRTSKTAETSRPVPPAVPATASIYDMTVSPGQIGPPQTRRVQVVSGLRDAVSPFTFAGEIISAGYSQVTNGSPNFGTNSLAFGSRAGASFARGSSQNIFSESVLAPLLREDSRYYQLGNTVPFFERLFYAGTRPLVSRTQSGHRTPNLSLLGGYLGAAYLTRTYNPVLNQSNDEVLKIYGTSLGGAAIGYVVTEFLPDTLSFLHLNHIKLFEK